MSLQKVSHIKKQAAVLITISDSGVSYIRAAQNQVYMLLLYVKLIAEQDI